MFNLNTRAGSVASKIIFTAVHVPQKVKNRGRSIGQNSKHTFFYDENVEQKKKCNKFKLK